MHDEMSIIAPAVLFAITLPIVALTLVFLVMRRAHKRRLAVWRALAQRLGGRLEEGHGFLRQQQDRLVAPIDGVTVALDLYVVSHGKSSTTYQRAATLAPEEWRRSVHVYKETPIFSAIGKAFGGQDIEIGDSEFDRAFIIKGSDPEWLRRSLSRGTRLAHLKAQHFRVTLRERIVPVRARDRGRPVEIDAELRRRVPADDGVLSVSRVGTTEDPEAIIDQLHLAAAYARDLFEGEGRAANER